MGMEWPVMQDLLLDEGLCEYQEFLEMNGYDSDLPLGPALLLDESKAVRARKAGEQKGHFFFAREPIPQIISLGLNKDQHFAEAVGKAHQGVFPFQDFGQPELDVEYAALCTAKHRANLAKYRTSRFAVLRQMAERLQSLNKRLQRHSQCRVSANMHVALVAYLVIIMRWPDFSLPLRLVSGLWKHQMLQVSLDL